MLSRGRKGDQSRLKKKISLKRIDTLIWPQICPHCGRSLKKTNGVSYELKIRKTLKALLMGGWGWKRLTVILCRPCADKISRVKTLETMGSILLFAAVLGVIFLQKRAVVVIYIGGAAFWLGVILMAAAEFCSQKLVGVECRLRGENHWELTLQNELFFVELQQLNLRYGSEAS
jgi:hypothetical protein